MSSFSNAQNAGARGPRGCWLHDRGHVSRRSRLKRHVPRRRRGVLNRRRHAQRPPPRWIDPASRARAGGGGGGAMGARGAASPLRGRSFSKAEVRSRSSSNTPAAVIPDPQNAPARRWGPPGRHRRRRPRRRSRLRPHRMSTPMPSPTMGQPMSSTSALGSNRSTSQRRPRFHRAGVQDERHRGLIRVWRRGEPPTSPGRRQRGLFRDAGAALTPCVRVLLSRLSVS